MSNIAWQGTTGDYTVASNWVGGVVPGSSDNAVFDASGINKSITIGTRTDVGGWIFNGGNYHFTASAFEPFYGLGVLINAGSVTLEAAASGQFGFYFSADAGGARFIADLGGVINFINTGGVHGDGILTAGSIEGAGTFDMGGNTLRVGSNDLSTTFSGTIYGPYGTGLIKVGTGTLTLSGDNNFNGAITIDGGAVDLASTHADIGSGIVFGPNGPETLRIEDAALTAHEFAPAISEFGPGNTIDLPGLSFVPGAAATYDSSLHRLAVTSGSTTTSFDGVSVAGPNIQFVALGDDTGGTRVMLGILGTAGNNLVDATHHPAGQPSPTNGPDVILGLAGNDTLKGLGGDDILVGGPGKDMLWGGPGADSFVFQTISDSRPSHPDTIMDFKHVQHDKIDLYDLFDATHHQPLVFIGAQTFAGYHHHHHHHSVFGMVRYAGGEVQVNVDAHLKTEFAIVMHGAPPLHAGDLIL